MITIFTPTYNREITLRKLYNSLIIQENKNFEWLVIDDGSTDDTEALINEFSKSSHFPIRYVYQQNAGKMSAYNKGIELAEGEIFICVDSDDYLLKDATKIISEYFEKINDPFICGVAFHNMNRETKKVSGTMFPRNDLVANHQELYYKYHIKGDKNFVFKTDCLKEYKHPIQGQEKFVPEAVLFNRIGEKYSFLCVNECVVSIEYMSDGYSNNYAQLAKNNPLGHVLYYKELFNYQKSLYNIYCYIYFSFISGIKLTNIFKDHQSKLLVFLLIGPTYMVFLKKGR